MIKVSGTGFRMSSPNHIEIFTHIFKNMHQDLTSQRIAMSSSCGRGIFSFICRQLLGPRRKERFQTYCSVEIISCINVLGSVLSPSQDDDVKTHQFK